MNKLAFTKGDWITINALYETIEIEANNELINENNGGAIVARFYGKDRASNALLASKAPRLYEQVKYLIAYAAMLEKEAGRDHKGNTSLKKARDLIAQIEGE